MNVGGVGPEESLEGSPYRITRETPYRAEGWPGSVVRCNVRHGCRTSHPPEKSHRGHKRDLWRQFRQSGDQKTWRSTSSPIPRCWPRVTGRSKPRIGHVDGDRRSRSRCGRGAQVVTSFGCSLFRVGFLFRKPLSPKPGVLSYRFTTPTRSSFRWSRV